MKNWMNSILVKKPGRNLFDLTHDVKFSAVFGRIYPCGIAECMPGDSWNLGSEVLTRLAPMITPVMHRFDQYTHCFFVANRTLWPGWENFITQQPTGEPAPAFPVLTVNAAKWDANPLFDYMGIPRPGIGQTLTVNAIPFAAYQAIYHEYYRDQNLVDAFVYTLVNGNNDANTELIVMRHRAWEHDYFTSCLPFAQKGAAVELPIAGFQDVQVMQQAATSIGSQNVWDSNIEPGTTPDTTGVLRGDSDEPFFNNQLYAETSQLEPTQVTINEIRIGERLQQWLEKAARAGSRYFEQILVHFGFKSPDKRVQRPEYITGTMQPVAISEVLNTTGTEDAPQGNMAGHGIALTQGYGGRYFCEEHGFLIELYSCRPKPSYSQGLDRFWSKTTDFTDYPFPEFAHLGEQAVLRKEIYVDAADPDGTFGYNPRYSEYRTIPNRIAGEFRDSLDFWTASRIFQSEPTLSKEFIEVDEEDVERIFSVIDPTVDKLYITVLNRWKVARSLPKFGTPTW